LSEADSILELASHPSNRAQDGALPEGAIFYRAAVQTDLGHHTVADSLLQIAYEHRVDRYGADHPKTALIVHYIAIEAERRGELDRAEDLKRRAYSIWSERLGEGHPMTVTGLNDLAVLLNLREKYSEAEEMTRTVVENFEKLYGNDHTETLGATQSLGSLLLRQGRLDEAEPYFHRAYDGYRQAAPNHYRVAFPLLSLTEVHLRKQRFVEAERTARMAMEHFSKTLPTGHPLFAVAQSRRGAALTGLRRYEEARSELTAGMAILQDATGFDRYRSEAEDWIGQLDVSR
jgi:tetratricopeptide (TPR) repeat protein